jgi:hypothetical protein
VHDLVACVHRLARASPPLRGVEHNQRKQVPPARRAAAAAAAAAVAHAVAPAGPTRAQRAPPARPRAAGSSLERGRHRRLGDQGVGHHGADAADHARADRGRRALLLLGAAGAARGGARRAAGIGLGARAALRSTPADRRAAAVPSAAAAARATTSSTSPPCDRALPMRES